MQQPACRCAAPGGMSHRLAPLRTPLTQSLKEQQRRRLMQRHNQLRAPMHAEAHAAQAAVNGSRRGSSTACRAQSERPETAEAVSGRVSSPEVSLELAGEDPADFRLEEQSTLAWGVFTALLVGALWLLYAVWISPDGGFADDYVKVVREWTNQNTELTVVAQLAIFALFHSGLAYLRPFGEKLIGARAWRVLFAGVSLPLAVVPVVYFINHRYSGVALWNIRGLPLVHESVWVASLISFLFLYPSTFNLLEVAAVDEPKLHLWDTGVTRITRHPQAFGQLIWCIAHTAWIGNSFMVTTSVALMVHHAFGCWHGDYRLRREWGNAFEEVKGRTSIVPFQAIWEGRQRLPADYWREWIRPSYAAIVAFSVATYYAHPLMQRASYWLGW